MNAARERWHLQPRVSSKGMPFSDIMRRRRQREPNPCVSSTSQGARQRRRPCLLTRVMSRHAALHAPAASLRVAQREACVGVQRASLTPTTRRLVGRPTHGGTPAVRAAVVSSPRRRERPGSPLLVSHCSHKSRPAVACRAAALPAVVAGVDPASTVFLCVCTMMVREPTRLRCWARRSGSSWPFGASERGLTTALCWCRCWP
jgi:hypothetical protein